MVMTILAASAALAEDGPPGTAGDRNGRSGAQAAASTNDDGPVNAGDHNGRSGATRAVSTGGDHPSGGVHGGVTPDGAKPGVAGGQN
jgi:hypothetical protein